MIELSPGFVVRLVADVPGCTGSSSTGRRSTACPQHAQSTQMRAPRAGREANKPRQHGLASPLHKPRFPPVTNELTAVRGRKEAHRTFTDLLKEAGQLPNALAAANRLPASRLTPSEPAHTRWWFGGPSRTS